MLKMITIATMLMSALVTFFASAQQIGTGDGGGGNTCMGRPIESYWFDVAKSPAFKKFIEPLLGPSEPGRGDVYRLFTYALRKKNWYRLPCPLPTLPAEKIGSVVKVDQGALQTFSEV